MRRRTASLALLIAPLSAALPVPAAADIIWPDHGRFALKPRISLSVRPAPIPLTQRQARIYAIELSPSPASSADLRLAVQRRRQRFLPTRLARLGMAPFHDDIQPRTSVTLAQVQADLPVDALPLGDRLTAAIGWQAVKINNRSVNVTSPYTRDDLRVRDAFLPSASATLAATDRLTLHADYGQAIRAYGDSGTIGSLGLTVADFRAFRNALRAERASLTRLGARWAAAPALHVGLHVFAGRVSDRLAFGAGDFLPRTMHGAMLQGVGVETAHRLSPTLDLTLRYDRARLEMMGADTDRIEQRLALQGGWRRRPWRSALTLARTSMPAWARPGHRLRLEGGIDYAPTDMPGIRLGLHLTDPDRLAMAHLPSGPVRAMDQSRALMLAAALRW